jgi:hypothetical protein
MVVSGTVIKSDLISALVSNSWRLGGRNHLDYGAGSRYAPTRKPTARHPDGGLVEELIDWTRRTPECLGLQALAQ